MNFLFTNIAYASGVDSFISKLEQYIVNPLITLLFALALVFFVYGVFEFISNAENEEKKTQGKSHMLWGIVGITIMMGVWFILHLVTDTLNISDQVDPQKGTVILN